VIARRRPPSGEAPVALGRLQRAVAGAATSAGDVHVLFRPVARQIAAERLAGRGVRLDAEPAAAAALLGADLYELVRPDRPPPEDAWAPGLGIPGLDELIDRLEGL
jgi:hypothetical protein